jgi:diguanylate cyclase (GGDEF)-like protein/PAS domain S-box-containing protein
MPSSRPRKATRDLRTASFVGILVAVSLLIAASTAFILWRSRVDAYRRADAATENILHAISEDLKRSLDFYDLSLDWAIAALSTPGFDTATEVVRRQMLFASDLQASILGGVLIADADGRALFESGSPTPRVQTIGAAPYFIALRDDPSLNLSVSRPFRPVTGAGLSIAVARRITTPDGRFGGAAVSLIKLSVILGLIQTEIHEDGDLVAVLNQDAILIARDPWDEKLVGSDMSRAPVGRLMRIAGAGRADYVSPVDGVSRLVRFAHLDGWPLVLMVGTPLSAVYAGWWTEALAIGGITTVTILLLLGLARALHLELGRRRRAELIARDGAEQFRMLAENVSDIIVRLDLDGVHRYVSPSIIDILGFSPEEMTGDDQRGCFAHPDDRPVVDAALATLLAGTEQVTVDYRGVKKTGGEAWIEARIRLVRDAVTGAPSEMIALARDVTLRYATEMELKRLATTDGLTGLANRRSFDEALDQEWRRAMRTGERVALLMLDADYFKLYNDRYGHPAGDAVLRMIAGALGDQVRRPGDMPARYGGEEFVLLLPGSDMAGAVMIAERIRADVRRRAVPHEGSPLRFVTVSIGAASCLVMADDETRTLIQQADLALYQAKRSGRDRVATSDEVVAVGVG